MRWLPEGTATALDEALRAVAPELAGQPIALPELAGQPIALPVLTGRDDPHWHSSSARLGEEFVAKFAWSEPAARRLVHEARTLGALAGLTGARTVPFLPELVAASVDPVLLVTRRVRGRSLFDVAGSIDRDRAGEQLARFLVALHRPSTRERVEAAVGGLPAPRPPAADLRDRFARWVRPDQRETVRRWCDWAATVPAGPRTVAVHGDLHGDNQVWDRGRLRLVVDFETVAAAEPEHDLRAFPGTGPGVELLTATMRHYRRLGGAALSVERVMAWHLRTALDDALWRSEAGVPLPGGGTPAGWVGDLAARFAALGLRPG